MAGDVGGGHPRRPGRPHQVLTTRGRALATADFTATLAVEAAIHYLDMTVALAAAPEPDPASLALVRHVLDQLAGFPLPASWDDVTCALKGTGRLTISQADQLALGPAVGKHTSLAEPANAKPVQPRQMKTLTRVFTSGSAHGPRADAP